MYNHKLASPIVRALRKCQGPVPVPILKRPAIVRRSMNMLSAIHIPIKPLFSERKNSEAMVIADTRTCEYAEYKKSDAPKLIPSRTNANELIGCVPANTGIAMVIKPITFLSFEKTPDPKHKPNPTTTASRSPNTNPICSTLTATVSAFL
nr:hypothetical protein Iba_chr12fCG2640 [Ipomoea batatas]